MFLRLSLIATLLVISTSAGASPFDVAGEKIASHPPQRALPEPVKFDLTKGPAYYVDPAQGQDSNDGSLKQPWQTIQHGVRQLKPGDTLYLRKGVYHEKVFLTESGTEESPIVISAYPGELPVLTGGLPEFLNNPAESWEPLKDGAPGEYVSTKSYPDAIDLQVPHQFLPGSWEPMWGKEEERPVALGHFADSMIPLHGYRTLADLRSESEYSPRSKDEGAVYCGPGMWFNRKTNRIHIRLAHNKLPGLESKAYQGETDPRKLPLVVALGFGEDVFRINGIKHVQIKGLVMCGATGSPMIHLYGSENIELDHVTIYGGFPALLVSASKDVHVQHSAFRGLAAPWSGRSHMKYRGTASYQIVLQNAQPYNENIEFDYCEFTDDHDFAFFRYARNLQFHQNFVDNFNDDGLECGAKLRWHTMQIHHNRIGACLGVFQQHEIDKDESPDDHDADSGLYIYRNIFDQRAGVYYHLPGEADPSGHFLRHEGYIASDHGSPVYPVMRFYQNTFVRRTPVYRSHYLFGLGTRGMGQTERDVFNNIFVQFAGTPGTVIQGKEAPLLREGGNLLWSLDKEVPNLEELFAKLRKSPIFASSKSVYEPGWSTDDLVADPKFENLPASRTAALDLRLTKGSPAIDAGLPLPSHWPDADRELDQGKPDIGAVPFGGTSWGVGVEGRIPVFGKAE